MSRRILIRMRKSDLILAGSEKLKGGRRGTRCSPDVRLLLELMLETGIPVSDAIRFDPAAGTRVNRDWDLPIHATKKQANSAVKRQSIISLGRMTTQWLSTKLDVDTSVALTRAVRLLFRCVNR